MAKLSSDKKYVTVEKGDTLSAIAKKYLGAASKYQQLASWNNIPNPDRIYVGQKIYLSKSAASSGSSTSTKKTSTSSNTVTITHFGLQSNTDNTLFVTWNWSKSNTESYLVEWTYYTRDNVWFIGDSSPKTIDSNNTAAARQSTYTIPSNAVKVRVRIKPIAKTKSSSNNKETKYWTASWSSYKTHSDYSILTTPSAPKVELDKYKLTASLENINIDHATEIQFQIYRNTDTSVYKTGVATISISQTASWSYTVGAGAEYRVRCRAKSPIYTSDWSAFSETVTTVPAASSGITSIKATSDTSIYLEWSAAKGAKTYDIEYATKKTYFDGSDQTSTKTGIEFTHFEVTGLESGQEYFFRVRAVNDTGESAWSEIKSVIVGKKPSAPTTWSSTTTCITGEPLNLYWVHNSEDNSSQTYAELEITIGTKTNTYTIKNSEDEELKDKTSVYSIDTTPYSEGTKILWRVRTRGIHAEYGDWSVQRTVDIYAPPVFEKFSVTDSLGDDASEVDVLTSFPFYIYALPGPITQAPLSYHVSIVANEGYETVDNVGNEKIISAGDEVYSEFYDISQSLLLELLPSSVDLENNISYTITCVVSMDSGLTAEATHEFSVAWTDEMYTPNAEIAYDPEMYVTHVRPYCTSYQTNYHNVTYASGVYTLTNEKFDGETLDDAYTTTGERIYVGTLSNGLRLYYCIIEIDENENVIDPIYYMVNPESGTYVVSKTVVNPSEIKPAYTSTGEEVFMATTEDGDVVYYSVVEGEIPVEDVTLSIYRREYDGRFVELGTGLNNTSNTFVTDPHPALDYARYRVIAVSNSTGAVSFYDVPGYPINEVGVIIQWDEKWSNYDVLETTELEQKPWSGSLIRLPYNIDVSDSSTPDSTQIEYIGRAHPVSYYGTQLGITSSWSMEIPKSDKETLYALRRLMIYMGDVYVREPSGSGYWANVKVSFSQTHCEVTIPVSLEITRVEGGA